jgi:hypothetical protein
VLSDVPGKAHQPGHRRPRVSAAAHRYSFFYCQRVTKSALIGLYGAWISGGVEWCWPLHHRPSTFMPVEHFIEEHADGSRTIWLSERDLVSRMKGMVGLRRDRRTCAHREQVYTLEQVKPRGCPQPGATARTVEGLATPHTTQPAVRTRAGFSLATEDRKDGFGGLARLRNRVSLESVVGENRTPGSVRG